jgi:uncharacterized protein YyaL (SSP411 family)
VLRSRYRPGFVVAGGPEGSRLPALMNARLAVDDSPAAYVCQDFSCRMPATDPAELEDLLGQDRSGAGHGG